MAYEEIIKGIEGLILEYDLPTTVGYKVLGPGQEIFIDYYVTGPKGNIYVIQDLHAQLTGESSHLGNGTISLLTNVKIELVWNLTLSYYNNDSDDPLNVSVNPDGTILTRNNEFQGTQDYMGALRLMLEKAGGVPVLG